MRQDQLLLVWLLSSVLEAVVSQVIHCTTSAELWNELHLRYSSQSLARAMDLKMQIHSLQKGHLSMQSYLDHKRSLADKLQIHSLQKGHLSMQSYLDHKRSLADKLRLIGSPVSDADLQLFILHGFGIDYDSLVVSLTSQSEVVSFNELIGLLLTHEQRLQKHSLVVIGTPSSPAFPPNLVFATSAASPLPEANLVSQSILGPTLSTDNDLMHQFSAFLASRNGWRGKQLDRTNDLMHQFSAFLASRNGWRGKQLDRTNSFVNTDRLLCQLCFKKDHTTNRCYKRFDATYKSPPPRPPPRSRQHHSQP
jgi:gag-polypeptide of LTR copia-type